MTSRRLFLSGGLIAVSLQAARKTYTWAEVERLLARGDVKGKLSKDELPTPALILDLDAFEKNVAKMFRHVKASGRAIRPHGKTHKCSTIANYLIRQGAVGACAAKLSEAEAFAQDGVTGLLITSAVLGKYKIERALRLARKRPETIFCVDNAQNVKDLQEAAAWAKLKLNLAIDLYVGNRTGIAPGEPAVALAQLIESLPHVHFAGLQAYAGQASHVVGFEARKAKSREAMTPAAETRRALERKGISCPLLTGGSTGTYNIDTDIDGITELQPGSFLFMDIDYNRIGGQSGDWYDDFQNALFVRTTVISKPKDDTAIVDAGLKAFSTDKPFPPQLRGGNDIVYAFAGDEHGRLTLQGGKQVQVGDRLEFIIPHCDPSVNLYDQLFAVRGEQVEAVWKISARGKSQ
ncbi:MAG: DSD1 family PLP-dependent enzyme [Bryobacteraceae bacterium]|nr:DSD1 family PLP-dependent enzyme [Bryobacteraceae bacterium]MDW8377674.1 DSD1 family PLP-dependent enzyme [Bryobacterales bacterium]